MAVTQTAAGAQFLALSGALTNGATANNICQSQTPGGAGNLTLNGSLVSSVPTGSAVAYLGGMSRIYITCAGDETGNTFTIRGLGYNASGGPFAVFETLTGPNASVIASQYLYQEITSIAISGAAADAMTVGRAGVATLDTPRRIIVTSGGDDTGITFSISGLDETGNLIGEVLTGADTAAAQSALDYKIVLSVETSGAVATNVSVGTNGVASSQWVRFDDYAANSQTTVACIVEGTVNYDVEVSLDDPAWLYSGIAPYEMTWLDSADTGLVNQTTSKLGAFAYTPLFARVTLNSGTGSVRGTFRQAYLS